ncbi:hypothetical protein [Actinoallomurus sp. CA-142502]|uniref:hypothetical protein n=1 Tax=Actinoallomurus sp. CA-142502 TaxID=3239885 RepID=UPI003D94B16A
MNHSAEPFSAVISAAISSARSSRSVEAADQRDALARSGARPGAVVERGARDGHRPVHIRRRGANAVAAGGTWNRRAAIR